MNICVFGASSNRLDPVYFAEAEAMGRLIAQVGHEIVFGGGADGLMGACARGAKAGGGRVVGIAPRLFNEPGFLLPECDELILTDTMSARKEKMMQLSDACLALPGGIGTMDEFFEAITLRQLGLLKGTIVLLNTRQFYTPLVSYLEEMAEQGFMSRNCLELIRLCESPAEALEALLRPDELVGSINRLEDYTK
ncbi:MAG: TIGR00730 family Rossman fold protein [Oscillospiraceae bacterium]|nr:TIGR00730 family Rossman fold protein [Oscillospiraceae bacterium]